MLGSGPRRNITLGSFFGTLVCSGSSYVEFELRYEAAASVVPKGTSTLVSALRAPAVLPRLSLALGEGTVLTLFGFRSRNPMDVGCAGVPRDVEGPIARALDVSRDENIARVRSSHGSAVLPAVRDCLPPRRFFVAVSS